MKTLIKKCIVCGKKFTKRVNESLTDWNNRHKFCSRKCSAKYHYKERLSKYQFTKEKHYIPSSAIKKGQRLSPKTEFKKGFIPWNKGMKPNKKWYEKMKKVGFFEIRFGEKSRNWKGGITKLGAAIRTMTLYKKWVKKCFKRDNYICQKCNARTKKGKKIYLQCHHKEPFYRILEKNKITTIEEAKNCKELWDINNGQTLCIPCHKQTDSYLVNQHTK